MSDTLDMTMMHAMHNALRREAEHLARVTARFDGDPRSTLCTAVGWDLLKKSLHVHHTAEDQVLWPALRQALANRPEDLTLLEALEAEHAAIAQVVEVIDLALTDPEFGLDRLGDLTDSLVTGLTGHLTHEEDKALPLIHAVVSQEQWARFGEVHGRQMGSEAHRLLPWLLDGASGQTITTMLASLPEPAYQAYRHQWQPAYTSLDRWSAAP
ncbi:hemerythrin domain-containing protein [Streptosporangium sp. CA-135522]|uniref:hemerythrin domain-containing protein n=1 Tax=Streptosporangium sp. CA-135522 TaxID=3240072 RepID=UPI003D8A38FD